MSDVPWRSDRSLDAATVARVVEAQIPHLAPCRATFLAEGWDTDAYVVNDSWVVRFPKRAAVVPSLDVERALLPRLAPLLPVPIPVPTLFGEPSQDFPFRFQGHRRLDGVAASRWRDALPAEPRHAATMGAFLAGLHAFPLEQARAALAPVRDPAAQSALLGRVRGWWPEVAPSVPRGLAPRVEAFLETEAPPEAEVAPRLLHGDLRPDHVLLFPDGRSVAGVIDWGDLSIGDPALDFAGLVMWGGEPFLRAVLSRYPATVDAGLVARSHRRAALASLSVLWWAVRAGTSHDIRIALPQLERALRS